MTKPKPNAPKSKHVADILVVDDTPANLRLLVDILSKQGYKVRPASNGKMALAAVNAAPPDIILLDVMMPPPDGFEVCRQLKANLKTSRIPVIFISALDSPVDKVKAFALGGVDFIAKPFHAEETLARIRTHLTIAQLQQDLQTQVAELDAFAHTVAHNLKSPLSVILGFTEHLAEERANLTPDELETSLYSLAHSSKKAINIVDELLLLSSVRKEDVHLEPLNMTLIVEKVQNRLSAMIDEYQGQITIPENWPVALGHGPWVEEIWMNYISNGLKYGGTPPKLTLGASVSANAMIQFCVKDNGPGISSEKQQRLFTEFTRLNQIETKGYGLGLSIVYRIVDKLGGSVGVKSRPGQGSTFYFTLPQA